MNYFIELLQVSLSNRKELSGIPTSKEWAVIFFESQRQAIIGVMLDGIERLPQSQRPQTDLLLQWIGNVQLIEQTSPQIIVIPLSIIQRSVICTTTSSILESR